MSEHRIDWSYQGFARRLSYRHEFASPTRACMLLLSLAQVVAILCTAMIAKIGYIDFYLGQWQSNLPYVSLAPVLAFALLMFYKSLGIDEIEALAKPTIGFGKVWGGLALAFLVVLGGLYLLKTVEFYSRGWFLCWFVLSAIAIVFVRHLAARLIKHLYKTGQLRQRLAVFGNPDYLREISARLGRVDAPVRADGLYSSEPGEHSAYGGIHELQQALEWSAYDTVLIGMPATETEAISRAVRELGSYTPEILLCTDLVANPLTVHGVRTVGHFRANVVSRVPASENNRMVKRLLDMTVATVGLTLLSPFLMIAALLIKLDSPGPVLFVQRRYGRNNKIFRIFKFRTMTVAEDDANVEAAKRCDPRVTRVGRILRATSFDELPQLVNVLRGDMSIVGPRPHALAHDKAFEQKLDRFSTRRQVLPGLTGWAQTNGYRGETVTTEDIRGRMQHDLYYIDNWSIWFDIEIMVRTVATVLRGAY